MSNFNTAKQRYEELGVDVDAALATISEIPISIHCWQGDDVMGFEGVESLTGGIQTTGNYPGKATTPAELMADFDKAISLIPGKKRMNLHASYAIFDGEKVDRDKLEPKHFAKWVEYAKSRNIGLDFNPTFFSHPLSEDGLTLSHTDEKIRKFWIDHGIACRRIAAYFAKELGSPCLNDVWIPDGYKDTPADRFGPRMRLKDSLDQIFAEKLDGIIDAVESKVFGIGMESFTVGSSEFYMCYAATHPGVYDLMDNGHYHPTEVVSDKISAVLPFFDKIPLHITRSVRWDSDHVIRLDDETKELAREIIRAGVLDKILIGLDFFDASINRIAAWIIGTRNVQKALLSALLEPNAKMKKLQDEKKFTELLVLQEELKTAPFSDIWEYYCQSQNVPANEIWLDEVLKYEKDVLLKR